ncbi:hypothetical protein F2Q69_00053025 [Brassica cretica]|uniref:Uncharacterized protein n=1 Tax=Brassica cretica TaxID=69181 RepID=A0A8S9MSE4_BRACR|nr:hypothetical protein F2Q69_00053025 [Brassica cretica]
MNGASLVSESACSAVPEATRKNTCYSQKILLTWNTRSAKINVPHRSTQQLLRRLILAPIHRPTPDLHRSTSTDSAPRTSIDPHSRSMVAIVILRQDENGSLYDQDGHLRNATGQKLDAQGNTPTSKDSPPKRLCVVPHASGCMHGDTWAYTCPFACSLAMPEDTSTSTCPSACLVFMHRDTCRFACVDRRGIARDLEVHIGNALVPVDLHVLDIKLNWNSSILLGRSFLSTVGAVCNMQTNQLCLTLIDPRADYDPIPVIKPQRPPEESKMIEDS